MRLLWISLFTLAAILIAAIVLLAQDSPPTSGQQQHSRAPTGNVKVVGGAAPWEADAGSRGKLRYGNRFLVASIVQP
jgi:hypothetical protein